MATGQPARVTTRWVVDLDDPDAGRVEVAGAKAASRARSRRAGLPVLDGFVVPVPAVAALHDLGDRPLPEEVRRARHALAGDGAVVVRSSSPHEDTATSSAAGRYLSVVGVGPDGFAAAVRAVARSARGGPMAVLVQPLLEPAVAGVAFALDPVTGRADRVVAAAVTGGPQRLVAGEVEGDRYELSRRGRLLARHAGDGGTDLDRRQRRAVSRLVARAAAVAGGPQDVEWAITADGRPVLLQARPVTARGEAPTGPRYGRGPVAETFPTALARLEQDLWLPPLRDALVEVAVLTGRASRRAAAAADAVVAPGGWVAVDLDLLEGRRPPGLRGRLDPRPGLRRLVAAWRTGRVAAAIDALAADVVEATDRSLAAVPRLDQLGDAELVAVLARTRAALVSLHGHEVLAGVAATGPGRPSRPGARASDAPGATGAEVALHALAEGRRQSLDDAEIRARFPEVLALTAPRIGSPDPLPADPPALRPLTVDDLAAREALRLRIRWVHELSARAAVELGRRLAGRGRLLDPADVRHLSLAQLTRAVLEGLDVAFDVDPLPDGPPPPVSFRLTPGGVPIAADDGRPARGDRVAATGTPAGGGRGAGPVHHGADPPPGSVLVVTVLDPSLAPVLAHVAGLVAETGSPLSHLAILAREHGVPTVVGAAGALSRFPPGQVVVVDGTTGDVAPLEEVVACP